MISVAEAAAFPRHARHLVDPERRRHAHPADRRRQRAGLVDRVRLHAVPGTCRAPVWMLLAPAAVLVVVPRDALGHHHPGDGLQREVGLPVRRFDHPGQCRYLRPVRLVRGRRRALPDHADRRRIADHRQGLHTALGRRGGHRRRQPVRRTRASRRHADRRVHPDAHRQSRLRPQGFELLAAGRIGRDPAAFRAGEFGRREGGAGDARHEHISSPATG